MTWVLGPLTLREPSFNIWGTGKRRLSMTVFRLFLCAVLALQPFRAALGATKADKPGFSPILPVGLNQAAPALPQLQAPLVAPSAAPAPAPSLAPVSGTSGVNAKEAIAFLKGRKKIRAVFVDAAGYGHQTATLSLIRRLRELGYEGKLEAVFENDILDEDRGLSKKLGQLLPEFDPFGPAVQHLPGLGLTMRDLGPRDRGQGPVRLEPVALAFTGGADPKRSYARKYNADVFLRLGPMGWLEQNYWEVYPDQLYRRDQEAGIPIRSRRDAPLIYRPLAEEMDDAWFSRIAPANLEPEKAAGLKTLARRIEEHDVLAAYGLQYFNEDRLTLLLVSISHAMETRPELFKGRGVVVPLLSEFQGAIAGVQSRLDHPRRDNGWIAAPRRGAAISSKRKAARRVSFADVRDPDLDVTLRRVGPGDIVVVETGAVPPALFERLFSASTLPPTLEGCNATNLARLLGLPFLPVTMWQLDRLVDRFAASEAKRREVSRLVYSRRAGMHDSIAYALLGGEGEFAFERIAAYIAAAMTPGSSLRRMFEDAKLRQDDYIRDKLVFAARRALAMSRRDAAGASGKPSP